MHLERSDPQPIDVLLLHVPKFRNYARPLGEFSFVHFPPIGLLGLAHFLVQNQHSARLLHLGVEKHLRGPLSFERILASHPASLIGLDLHWHFQSWDTIEAARKIKEARPNLPICLGGFTASLFADDILQSFPFIDFIIRGDGEIPLLALTRALRDRGDLRSIPNLSWRDGAGIRHNPTVWAADSKLLNSISFTDFTLMEDYPTYVKFFSRYVHLKQSGGLQRLLLSNSRSYPIYIGRGCAYDCSFCGGCNQAQILIANRKDVPIRSVDAIVSSIHDLVRFSFDFAILAMDCFPLPIADQTYIQIFDRITAAGLPINIEVERDFLPTEDFVRSFSRLPGKESFITISPHTQNEELRRRNGFYRYSNQALEECLALLDAHGVNSRLYFACGLPFETEEDLAQMATWQPRLRFQFKNVRIRTTMIELEPGSPMSRMPADYGLNLERKTFSDYYSYHSHPGRNPWGGLGYCHQGTLTASRASSFFCANFCDWAPICDSRPCSPICSAYECCDKPRRALA